MSNFDPGRPGWAAPTRSRPPRAGGKPKAGKIAGLGCLGLVGLLVLFAAVGALAGGKQADTVSSRPAPAVSWHSTAPATVPAPTTAPAAAPEPSSPPAATDAPPPVATTPAAAKPTAAAKPAAPAKPVTPTTPAAPVAPTTPPDPGGAACHPLTNAGHCYLPGEFCRATDHGVTGIDGRGNPIICRDNNKWRWEPA
ncbi:hypothetical protein C7C46_28280 [Streptomyces tateyamensis]|uniref:Uncharacterized protein n=1 Tax=Streptomyces tateyamensis TaxID=565073 RepID=A0A2V4N931_9ACTN|nr:hypothetical protein [Streptomyces tateyamensis]PYC69150.1 hypothetical protein C7C46_28280 [Streptomyces tateyamensis]